MLRHECMVVRMGAERRGGHIQQQRHLLRQLVTLTVNAWIGCRQAETPRLSTHTHGSAYQHLHSNMCWLDKDEMAHVLARSLGNFWRAGVV